MMNPFAHISCILLSAGSSDRMGKHKALLNYDEDSTFVQRISDTYSLAGIEQIIVVVNADLFDLLIERHLNLHHCVKVVINKIPDLGRFHTLQTGVLYTEPGNYCFFQNIDNPFTSVEVLKSLIQYREDADVIIPTFQNKSGHPVLFSSLVAQEILLEKTPDLRIDEFLKKFKVIKVEVPNSNILININSQEEFLKAGFK